MRPSWLAIWAAATLHAVDAAGLRRGALQNSHGTNDERSAFDAAVLARQAGIAKVRARARRLLKRDDACPAMPISTSKACAAPCTTYCPGSPDGFNCRNTQADTANCGGCGITCTPPDGGSAACTSGACQFTCPDAQDTYCDGQCTDTQTDIQNCGGCNKVCTDYPGFDTLCVSGHCAVTCPSSTTLCGGQCVDTQTDLQNCGGCDMPCNAPTGGTATCSNGVCETLCPASTPNTCHGQCVNTQTDSNFCGGCDVQNKCYAPGGGFATCSGGHCQYGCTNPAYTPCFGNCVNTQTDINNCGGCFEMCLGDPGDNIFCYGGNCYDNAPVTIYPPTY